MQPIFQFVLFADVRETKERVMPNLHTEQQTRIRSLKMKNGLYILQSFTWASQGPFCSLPTERNGYKIDFLGNCRKSKPMSPKFGNR